MYSADVTWQPRATALLLLLAMVAVLGLGFAYPSGIGDYLTNVGLTAPTFLQPAGLLVP